MEFLNSYLNLIIIGLCLLVVGALIILGGLRRIAKFAEVVVPFMAVIYIIGGVIVLVIRAKYLPDTFCAIFKYAFMPEALIGGGFGYALKTAISQGVKRGLFSNEAGMGSTPHAHAVANVKDPHTQGTVAMVGVFIDTVIVLTLPALIVISTIYVGDGALAKATGETYGQLLNSSGITQTNMVQRAISSVTTANIGNVFVAVCLLFFAFSTILSWNFFGKINFHYLFGKKAVIIYSALAIVFIFLGTMMKSSLVWALQDMFNQLMVLPNVIALFALSKMVTEKEENKG
jgi:AGCS family alanine or glycine:cation symporter